MGINLELILLGKEVEKAPDNVLTFKGLGGDLRLHPRKWRGRAYWAMKPFDDIPDNEASCFNRNPELHEFLIVPHYWDYSENEEGREWTTHWHGLVDQPELIKDFIRFVDPHNASDWYPADVLLNYDYSQKKRVGLSGEIRPLTRILPDWYFDILRQCRENDIEHIIFTH